MKRLSRLLIIPLIFLGVAGFLLSGCGLLGGLYRNLKTELDFFRERIKSAPSEVQVEHRPGYSGGGSDGTRVGGRARVARSCAVVLGPGAAAALAGASGFPILAANCGLVALSDGHWEAIDRTFGASVFPERRDISPAMPDQPRSAPVSGSNIQTFPPPVCATLLEIATPQLYRENPFRQTGLRVLAGTRDVAKRIDQLNLSAELDTVTDHWSFAPGKALSVDQLREVAQVLKEPAARLVHELFWFWPEKYPVNSPADPAINFLAQGETLRAVELWENPAMDDRPAARHNLAVYYHQQALEMERLESPDEQDLAQLWLKAIRFWDRIRGDEAVWMRLRARVGGLADARVPVALVGQLRATVPEALAKICAALALSHGEQGRGTRSALHSALVIHIQGDSSGARRALEARAAPIARRIDSRVSEARNRASSGAAANGLTEIMALIRANDEDLHLIEILCGRTAEYYREVSLSVADTVLDGLVAYQRETGDDCGCLPVLVYLLDMEATPELKRRLADTCKIVHSNVLSGQHRDVPEKRSAPGADEPGPSDHEKNYRLVTEHIIPGLPRLELGKASRKQYSARVAGMLKNLAFAAYHENDNHPLAMKALATALALPCSYDVRVGLDNDRAQLQREFATQKEKELRLQTATSVLQINRQGIDLDGRWTAATDLAGLRHGIETGARNGAAGAATYVIVWRTTGGEEFALHGANLLAPSAHAGQDYARILDAFYYFFVPGLVDRLAAAVRRGEQLLIGETPVTRQGMLLASPARFGVRDEIVAYASLECRIEGGQLALSSKLNPWLSDSYAVADTWNAVICRQLVEAVQRG